MTGPYSPPLDEITTALLDLLNANEPGRKVWDGVYGGDPVNPTYPYGILYRIAGGSADPMPDLDDEGREVTVPYQVTTVSNLRNQCEQTARVLHDQLLARDGAGGWLHELVVPDGWQCIDRRPDPQVPGVDRVGEAPAAVFSSPARYLLTLAPTD